VIAYKLAARAADLASLAQRSIPAYERIYARAGLTQDF
jgi:hypothetical protein